MPNPKTIIQWSNGIVAVLDENGREMLEYQGPRADVVENLALIDLSMVKFEIGSWREGLTVPCTKEDFFSKEWGTSAKPANVQAN